MSITFIQHSLQRHSPFRPAGSLQNAAIVTLSDGCTLRIESSFHDLLIYFEPLKTNMYHTDPLDGAI